MLLRSAPSSLLSGVFIRPQVQDQTPDRDDQFGRFRRFDYMSLEPGFERIHATLGAAERR
jgi:hypothetical protein